MASWSPVSADWFPFIWVLCFLEPFIPVFNHCKHKVFHLFVLYKNLYTLCFIKMPMKAKHLFTFLEFRLWWYLSVILPQSSPVWAWSTASILHLPTQVRGVSGAISSTSWAPSYCFSLWFLNSLHTIHSFMSISKMTHTAFSHWQPVFMSLRLLNWSMPMTEPPNILYSIHWRRINKSSPRSRRGYTSV